MIFVNLVSILALIQALLAVSLTVFLVDPLLVNSSEVESFPSTHQSIDSIKSKLANNSIKVFHSYAPFTASSSSNVSFATGFHIVAYHSTTGFYPDTVIQKLHSNHFDVDRDLAGLLIINPELRCASSSFEDSEAQNIFKISLRFNSSDSAAAALKRFEGSDFKFLNPDDEHSRVFSSRRVPFSIKGCTSPSFRKSPQNEPARHNLIALSVSLDATSLNLQVVARGAMPHEIASPNTEGGFIMRPIALPSSIKSPSGTSTRNADAQADVVTIIYPIDGVCVTARSTIQISYTVSSSCTRRTVQLFESLDFRRDPLLATGSTSVGFISYTLPDGNGAKTVYVYVTCTNAATYSSNSIKITWVNPSNPNRISFANPTPFSVNSRSQDLTLL